jgi:predicted amidophosphoribosyltransferase
MRRRSMQRGSTILQRKGPAAKSTQHSAAQAMKSLGALPRILCWNCRRLTSFKLDRCQHCGSAFAGSTGGAYRTARNPAPEPRARSEHGSSLRPRSLREIVEDLQRVRDLADSPREPPREEEVSLLMFQCPTCGRFVSQAAQECVCGVRFAPPSEVTFQCPECASNVPSGGDECPVCGVGFRAVSFHDDTVYACPRCGTHVDSDAVRCACGAWFED